MDRGSVERPSACGLPTSRHHAIALLSRTPPSSGSPHVPDQAAESASYASRAATPPASPSRKQRSPSLFGRECLSGAAEKPSGPIGLLPARSAAPSKSPRAVPPPNPRSPQCHFSVSADDFGFARRARVWNDQPCRRKNRQQGPRALRSPDDLSLGALTLGLLGIHVISASPSRWRRRARAAPHGEPGCSRSFVKQRISRAPRYTVRRRRHRQPQHRLCPATSATGQHQGHPNDSEGHSTSGQSKASRAEHVQSGPCPVCTSRRAADSALRSHGW